MAEIINLSDDDDDIIQITSPLPKKRKRFKCLNADCRSEENLLKATIAVRRYYGVLPFPKKIKVCAHCSAYAKIKADNVIDSVRNGKLLLNNPDIGKRNTVVVTESDSDLTDNGSDSEESLFEYDPSELGVYNEKGDMEDDDDARENLKGLLSGLCDNLELKRQIDEGAERINARLLAAEKGFNSLNSEYHKIENKLDHLRNNFYNTFKQGIQWLPPLEIGASPSYNPDVTEVLAESPIFSQQHLNLPPMGPLVRPELKPNDLVFSIRFSLFAKWVQATVVNCDSLEAMITKTYTICYNRNITSNASRRNVSAKNLAYFNPSSTRIPVGTRVIARYKEESLKTYNTGSFFVGIIAEIPTVANKYRYLIFFDDGYAQYVNHQDIRVVVESSSSPWEDVAADSREFIKDYLHTYPERPMVRLQKWNYIKTEWNGRWWKAQVLEVDGSLVKMYFPVDGRSEWIYRGSTRLSPLFNKKLNIQSQAEQPSKVIRRRTLPASRSGPVVEYVNHGQGKENQSPHKLSKPTPLVIEPTAAPTEKRAVARKSTSGRPGTPPLEVQEQIYQESRGFIRRKPLKGRPIKFVPHQCSAICCADSIGTDLANVVCSPLLKPLIMKWCRLLIKEKKKTISRNSIAYIAPCGRRLRSIKEVFRYLRITESDLEIDFFSFDLGIDPTNNWEPAKVNIALEDITNGVEEIKISCINSLDTSVPQPLIYRNVRQPTENVNLNLDPSFLVCCSCIDDCQNKEQCECWQLTREAAQIVMDSDDNSDVGYNFRRLNEQVSTGIYECNSLCSCKKTCLNRVVQHPIRQQLQLFKTAKRGWGVRTLHDIPQGGFICVYVGKVLSESVANQEGKMTSGGDDYYAELDFIEVVEGMKEGYESGVEENEDESGDEKDKYSNPNSKKQNDDYNYASSSDSESDAEDAPTVTDAVQSIYDVDKDFSVSKKNSVNQKPPEIRKPSARIQARSTRSESGSNDVSRSGSRSPTEEGEKSGNEDEDDGEETPQRQPKTFEPLQTMAPPPTKELSSARELFGLDEAVYIMDAKVSGNIGRYFNHSCQPNVFVQNVFVDTHDLRFPWVAFFASTRIRAGVELTWDYNYEVGSVPGKIKYCYCMAKKCRGRLL